MRPRRSAHTADSGCEPVPESATTEDGRPLNLEVVFVDCDSEPPLLRATRC